MRDIRQRPEPSPGGGFARAAHDANSKLFNIGEKLPIIAE
jgi:hypothetical protein